MINLTELPTVCFAMSFKYISSSMHLLDPIPDLHYELLQRDIVLSPCLKAYTKIGNLSLVLNLEHFIMQSLSASYGTIYSKNTLLPKFHCMYHKFSLACYQQIWINYFHFYLRWLQIYPAYQIHLLSYKYSIPEIYLLDPLSQSND